MFTHGLLSGRDGGLRGGCLQLMKLRVSSTLNTVMCASPPDALWAYGQGTLSVDGTNATAGIFATYPSPHLSLLNGFFDQVAEVSDIVSSHPLVHDKGMIKSVSHRLFRITSQEQHTRLRIAHWDPDTG